MVTITKRALILAILIVVGSAADTFASHFRSGTIRWRYRVDIVNGQPVVRPNIIIFTVNSAWRRSFYGNVNINSFVGLGSFNFGDGTTTSMNARVTALSVSEDWIDTTFEVTKTYNVSTAATFSVTAVNGCCRISTLQDTNRDTNYILRTIVPINMGAPNSSPSSGTLPVITVPHNSPAATFSIAASDPEGDGLTYSIAPTLRSGLNRAAPAGLSINSATGLVTWNTTSAVLNGLYAVQFLVDDSKGASVPVDVILRPVAATLQPPTMLINGSQLPATFSVPVGTTLSFTATGTDPNVDPGTGLPNRFVSLTASGIPVGASLVPSLPVTLRSPASTTFTWTPGPTAVGNHTLTFGVTSGTGQQDTNTVTIIVPQFNRAPTVTCPEPLSVRFGEQGSLSADVADLDGDALTVEWDIDNDGTVDETDHVAASTTTTSVSLTGDFGTAGQRVVKITITDTAGASTSCTASVTVTPADQLITFDVLPDVHYGSAPIALTATASSSLPVSFVLVSGPASLNGSVLTIAGVGTVHVRATQAGNSNYNPAPDVDQSFSVAPASLALSFTVADKVYDGTTSATITGRSVSGIVNGDQVSATGGVASFDNKAVGQGKTVTGSGFTLTGAGSANYVIASIQSATASITVRPVTAAFTAASKTYDGGVSATVLTRSLHDALGGDDVGLSGGTASFDDKTVGTGKPVTLNGASLAGTDASNYTLTSIATTTADITALGITGSFTAADKPYDGTVSATVLTRSVNLAVPGDDVSLSGGAATFDSKTAGTGKTVSLAGASLAGIDAINYTLISVGTATASVTPLSITGHFTAAHKVYDGNTAATVTTRTVSGEIAGDIVELAAGTATFDTRQVGSGKTVTLTGAVLGGADAANYILASVATTLADISPLSISGSFTAANKTYDGTTAASVMARSLTGAIGEDAVTLVGGTATFDTKSIGTAKTVTLSGATLAGTDSANYTLSGISTTTADITALVLAGTFTAADKIYDGNAAASVLTRAVIGAISGDDVSLTGGTAAFDTPFAGNGKPVTLLGAALAGSDAGNYSLQSVNITVATITPRPATVAATNQSMLQGSAMPVFGGTLTGFLPTDTMSASYSTAADGLNVGLFPIVPTLLDPLGRLSNYSVTTTAGVLSVLNVAPTVASIVVPTDPVANGTAISISSSFSDPGQSADGQFIVTINWGKHPTTGAALLTTLSPSPAAPGGISATYTYPSPGVYSVTVTVADKHNASGSQTTTTYVVVYDPNGGFVTGGGWIDSPPGAFDPDPSLTGRANFGFVSKYQKGARTPTGTTEFHFQAGGFNFHSNVYDWLVVAGARGQYKGSGTVNGQGGYSFLLTVTDGQVVGGDGFDKFRIKIWETANESNVVYDNLRGQADDEQSPTPVAGGSIVIHEARK